MAYRRFTDREGVTWEVLDRSTSEWELQPVSQTGRGPVRVAAPGYERDPFELSVEELQRLLDGAPRPGSGPRRSPFKD
jgi:hypothetical protein